MNISHHQKGHGTILLITVILPFLVFIGFLTVDIDRYKQSQRVAQQTLDAAALAAHHYLPDTSLATRAVHRTLTRTPEIASHTTLQISEQRVRLDYRAVHTLSFPLFFGSSSGVAMAVHTETRRAPRDVLLAFDLGQDLLPPTGGAFGEPALWPAADYFAKGARFDPEARQLTQRCFGPPLLAMKRAVIGAYAHLERLGDGVGVGVFPGVFRVGAVSRGPVLDLLRPVTGLGTHPELQGDAVAHAVDTHPDAPDLECHIAAAREFSTPLYRFPLTSATHGDPPPMSDVVWSQAAMRGRAPTDDVIRHVVAALRAAERQTAHGTLIGSSIKHGIILLGGLPTVRGLRSPHPQVLTAFGALVEELGQIDESQLHLTLIVLAHEGNDHESLEEDLRPLQRLLESDSPSGSPRMKLLVARDDNRLFSLVGMALASGQFPLIAR